MQWNRLIHTIKDEDVLLDRRLAILDVLYDVKKPDALIGICQSCLARQPDVAKKSQQLLKKLEYRKFSDMLDFALDDESNSFSGMQILTLLYKLRGRDVLKYIVGNLSHSENSTRKRKTIAVWLRQSQLMDRCVSGVLSLPKEIVHTVAAALKNLDSGITIDIAKIAKTAPPELSLKALDLLEEMGVGSEIIPSLMGLLSSRNTEIRAKATYIICKVSSNIQLLEYSLKDRDEIVRADAIRAMWGVNHPHIRDLLLPCLYEPGDKVRANAAKALYMLRDRRGLNTLMEMLRSSEPMTRSSAALALGELNEASASERLAELVETDESEMVRDSARKALEQMNRQLSELANQLYSIAEAVNELEAENCQEIAPFTIITNALNGINSGILTDMTKNIAVSNETCLQMVHVLRNVSSKEMALPVLIKSLFNEDNEMSQDAILSLQEISQNLKSLESGLRHAKPIVRNKAIQSLCEMQEPAVESFLVPNLETDNSFVVANAAKALCDMEHEEGMGALVKMMRSPDESMRASAMWALGRVGIENVEKQLEILSESGSIEVKESEIKALVKITNIASKEIIEPMIKHIDAAEFPTVTLCVSVCDGEGQPIGELTNDSFLIIENSEIQRDIPVKCSKGDMPIAIAIAIDYSLSMAEDDIENVENATLGFVGQMREMDSGAVIKFAEQVSVLHQCSPDKEEMQNAVKTSFPQGDGTALYDAIYESINQISRIEGMRSVIVITDGEDTDSTHSLEDVVSNSQKHKISIHAIGLGDSLEGYELQKIAEATKGKYYPLTDSKDLNKRYNLIQQALREHYRISYTSKTELGESIGICVKHNYITGNDFAHLPKLIS